MERARVVPLSFPDPAVCTNMVVRGWYYSGRWSLGGGSGRVKLEATSATSMLRSRHTANAAMLHMSSP